MHLRAVCGHGGSSLLGMQERFLRNYLFLYQARLPTAWAMYKPNRLIVLRKLWLMMLW